MLITSLIYSSFNKALKEHNVKEAPESVLLNARFLKLHRNSNNKWNLENINHKHVQLFEDFGIDVLKEVSSI